MSQIIRGITEIARCGAQYRSDALAPMGLKACHASYLAEISAHPGISQDQLSKRIYINKSNVARQAAVLEENGFITRTPSESDRRIMKLYPTEKALELLPKIEPLIIQWESYLTNDLSDAETALLEKLLTRMQEKASDWMNNH